MKNIVLLSLSILLTQLSVAQLDTVFIRQNIDWAADVPEYETDTVFFESGMMRHILTGTTVLPYTHNQLNARGYGLLLEKVTKSDCQNHGEEVYKSKDKINFVEMTDTTLIVDINIYDNCCYDFLCDAAIDTSGTLNLIYHGYGNYCGCDCCFGLTFHFVREFFTEKAEIISVLIQGDAETRKKLK